MKSKFAVLLLLFFACASAAPLGQPVTIAFGRSVMFEHDLRVAFSAVVSDSRCPVNVTCIQKGDIVVELTVSRENDSERVQLSLDHPHGEALGHPLELRAVDPPPVTPPQPHESFSATIVVM